jgi:DNA-binding HxlR family transcriptional regulator
VEDDPGASELDWATIDASQCSIAHAASILGDRWSLLVLREIALGVDRFDGVQAHLDVSRRTLTDRLNGLVAAGVIERVPYKPAGQRVRHRYRLTPSGQDLRPLLQALGDWGAQHRPDDVGPPVTVARCDCGAPGHLVLRCDAGHELDRPHRTTRAS